MFLWVTLPAGIDSQALLQAAIARNVAFVPGAPFFAADPQHNTLRLSFVTVSAEEIERGIGVLGQLLHESVRANAGQAA